MPRLLGNRLLKQRPRRNRLAVLGPRAHSREDAPPVVDQRHHASHQLAPLEIAVLAFLEYGVYRGEAQQPGHDAKLPSGDHKQTGHATRRRIPGAGGGASGDRRCRYHFCSRLPRSRVAVDTLQHGRSCQRILAVAPERASTGAASTGAIARKRQERADLSRPGLRRLLLCVASTRAMRRTNRSSKIVLGGTLTRDSAAYLLQK